MGSSWKTARLILLCLAIMLAGFWASVTFLGENWSDQANYLLGLLSLLLLILVSAAVLLGAFKLLGALWQRLTGLTSLRGNEGSTAATHNEQE